MSGSATAVSCVVVLFFLQISTISSTRHPSIKNITLFMNGEPFNSPVAENSTVVVICSWDKGSPAVTSTPIPQLYDEKGRILQTGRDLSLLRIIHHMGNVVCQDAGRISCSFPEDQDGKDASLLVKCAPFFNTVTPLEFKATVEGTALLQFPVRTHTTHFMICEMGFWPPVKNRPFAFKYCNRFARLTGSPPDLMLEISLRDLASENDGTFRLSLTNDIGVGHVDFSIRTTHDPYITSLVLQQNGERITSPIAEGSVITVVCSWAEGSLPSPSWPRILDDKEKELPASRHPDKKTTIFHSIDVVVCQDAGLISCSFPEQGPGKSAALLVECAPEFDTSTPLRFKPTPAGRVHLQMSVRTHTSRFTGCSLSLWPQRSAEAFHPKYCDRSAKLYGSPPYLTFEMTLNNMISYKDRTFRLNLTNDVGVGHVTFHIASTPARTGDTTTSPAPAPSPLPSPVSSDDSNSIRISDGPNFTDKPDDTFTETADFRYAMFGAIGSVLFIVVVIAIGFGVFLRRRGNPQATLPLADIRGEERRTEGENGGGATQQFPPGTVDCEKHIYEAMEDDDKCEHPTPSDIQKSFVWPRQRAMTEGYSRRAFSDNDLSGTKPASGESFFCDSPPCPCPHASRRPSRGVAEPGDCSHAPLKTPRSVAETDDSSQACWSFSRSLSESNDTHSTIACNSLKSSTILNRTCPSLPRKASRYSTTEAGHPSLPFTRITPQRGAVPCQACAISTCDDDPLSLKESSLEHSTTSHDNPRGAARPGQTCPSNVFYDVPGRRKPGPIHPTAACRAPGGGTIPGHTCCDSTRNDLPITKESSLTLPMVSPKAQPYMTSRQHETKHTHGVRKPARNQPADTCNAPRRMTTNLPEITHIHCLSDPTYQATPTLTSASRRKTSTTSLPSDFPGIGQPLPYLLPVSREDVEIPEPSRHTMGSSLTKAPLFSHSLSDPSPVRSGCTEASLVKRCPEGMFSDNDHPKLGSSCFSDRAVEFLPVDYLHPKF